MGLAPYFENGTLRTSQSQEELILEHLRFPKGQNDDIPDALNLAFRAARSYPRPDIPIFEPPSNIPRIDQEDDGTRFNRGMRS
jgi:hypothetical protein